MRGQRTKVRSSGRHDIAFVTLAAVVIALTACTDPADGETRPVSSPSTSASTPTEEATPSSVADADTELVFGTPTTMRLTPAGESWIDPEILASTDEPLITWQQPGGEVIVAQLDPVSGRVDTASVRTVATDAASARSTFNGPEFGRDETGWSVSYTSVGVEGTSISVARPSAGGTGFDVETIAGDQARFSPLASQVPDGDTTRLVYLAESPGWGRTEYLDLADPTDTNDIAVLGRRTDGDVRWVPGTYLLATNHHPDHPGALALVDTETGSSEAVSVENVLPSFPYGWIAPDATSDVAVLGVVDETQLVTWASGRSLGEGAWEQWHVLTSPEPEHAFFGSPEPFVVDDRSFVSVTVAPTSDQTIGVTDQQVWLMSLDGSTSVRCDDGRDAPTTRVDPEVLVVDERVFVYYYVLDEAGSTVHVCSVDLVPSEAAPVVELREVTAEQTDPSLETLNGNHLIYAPPADPLGQLLVFFPGTGATPDRYETYLAHAGSLGFHVIGLGYDNLESVNFQLCPGQPPGCHEAVRREILFGEASDYSPPDVSEANSAIVRLRSLITHLDETDPNAGWDDFLNPTDADGLLWSDITVAGHSQGGGHAAYLATQIEVDRAILFGATEPQLWTRADSATPPDRYYALSHRDERSAAAISVSWENLGIPGDLVAVEDAGDQFDGSHRLQTTSDDCSGDPDDRGFHHNCYIVDEYLPAATGQPHYADVWTYMLTDTT